MRFEKHQLMIYDSGEQLPEIHLKQGEFALVIACKPCSDETYHHLAVIHFNSMQVDKNNKFEFKALEKAYGLLSEALGEFHGPPLKMEVITPEVNLQKSRSVLEVLFKINDIQASLDKRMVLINGKARSIKKDGVERLIEKLTYHPYSHFKIMDFNQIESIQPIKTKNSPGWKFRFWPSCLSSKETREKLPANSTLLLETKLQG